MVWKNNLLRNGIDRVPGRLSVAKFAEFSRVRVDPYSEVWMELEGESGPMSCVRLVRGPYLLPLCARSRYSHVGSYGSCDTAHVC